MVRAADGRLGYTRVDSAGSAKIHVAQVRFTSPTSREYRWSCAVCTAFRPRPFYILLLGKKKHTSTLLLTRHIPPRVCTHAIRIAKRTAYCALYSTAPHVPARYGSVQYSTIPVRACIDSYPCRSTKAAAKTIRCGLISFDPTCLHT